MLKVVNQDAMAVPEHALVVNVKRLVVPVVNPILTVVENVEEHLVLVLIAIVIAKLAVVLADAEAVRKVVVLVVEDRVHLIVLVPPHRSELYND